MLSTFPVAFGLNIPPQIQTIPVPLYAGYALCKTRAGIRTEYKNIKRDPSFTIVAFEAPHSTRLQ